MGIPLPSMPSPREIEVDFEQDAHLKKMLERKHKLEEAESYNSPETMQKKRKAVKEQALAAPKQRSPSTDLQFDDNIEDSPVVSDAAGAAVPKRQSASRTTKTKAAPKHRAARRSRAAARRKEAKAKVTADPDPGQEHSPEQKASSTRRGRRRSRGPEETQQPSAQLKA